MSHLAMLLRTLFLLLAANQHRWMQGEEGVRRSVARRPGEGWKKNASDRGVGTDAPSYFAHRPSANCFTHIDPYFIVINMVVNLPSTCIHSSVLAIHVIYP
jgi:hypothetical protein